MLELLFQGFIEWIYGLILECWEYFASVLFDLMSLDFAYLREHMPVIDTIRQIMLGVGWALLIGNLVFQATRGMAAGLGFDAEDPKLLFTSFCIFLSSGGKSADLRTGAEHDLDCHCASGNAGCCEYYIRR